MTEEIEEIEQQVNEILHGLRMRIADWKDSFDSESWDELPLGFREELAKYEAYLESYSLQGSKIK